MSTSQQVRPRGCHSCLKQQFRLSGLFARSLFFFGVAAVCLSACVETTWAQTTVRRVNVPYFGSAPPADNFVPAIFWFGRVEMTTNYADVRVWHYDQYIKFVLHIPDRVLWSGSSSDPSQFTQWDAVSIYIDLIGNSGQVPQSTSYCFVNRLGGGEAVYRGTGSGWELDSVPFTASDTWRGNYPNDDVWDMGWQAEFQIPFSSLGLSGPPVSGTRWGLAVVVHDRDDQAGTFIPDQIWPETMQSNRPETWGQLQFGRPVYTPPTPVVSGTTVVRNGLNGAVVVDAAVGGHTVCGDSMNAWTEWGNANYAGYGQFNIQNQWDIADFMCFSKYYVTFPLTGIPAGKSIVSASVTLNIFGNAGYTAGDSKPSAINALTVSEDWVENEITWNNAPYASENISVTWVYAVDFYDPGVPYEWDVSYAVAEAYRRSKPLRLAFYSTDGDYHSGKYFWSSDAGTATSSIRPTLEVNWADSSPTPPAAPSELRVVER